MAQVDIGNTKAKLRRLRDQVAFEVRRAQGRERTPPELLRRLLSVAELLESVCLLKSSPDNAEQLEEAYGDALVETHLAMHEWERFRQQDDALPAKVRSSRPPATQRVHARQPLEVSVKLRRFAVQETASEALKLEQQMTSLPARNISAGGLFVVAPATTSPELLVGNVVAATVSIVPETRLSFRTRAVIARRDDEGMGLRWVADESAQRAIRALVDAIQRVR